MKLKKAIEIGKECGLETARECVYNIVAHADMLFPYEKITEELNELIEDAKKHGVEIVIERRR
ncbi:MAG: hypothetical protein ACTSUO_00755 [Candidatus Thorarchaeota archaeon]